MIRGLLAEGNRFIPDLIRQTYHGWAKGRILDVLVAVIDRISYPSSQIKKAGLDPGQGRIGYSGKGISVMLTDSEVGAPDLWSQREQTDQKASSTAQRRSTLSFQFGANSEHVDRNEKSTTPKLFLSRTVKLPVANTIFHNGRESTIQAQRWIVGETILEPALACIKRTWLKEQVLRMAFPFPDAPDKFPTQVFIPLSPITRPKRVATSMGNVIRQFYARNEHLEPASKDLETAVAHWISQTGNERKAVEVWALISPPKGLRTFNNYNFSKVIRNGGHFHKVLSGGGGWGNRQGLLALDPEVDFDVTPKLRMTEDLESEFAEDRSRASSQVVNPGDMVSLKRFLDDFLNALFRLWNDTIYNGRYASTEHHY
ncbi:MAG: hypothetical protein L6R40_002440 [Gallowayella cf. fulva]|nr:MAG: hypothetical protein L6R40_002440 [Xanthomendoza cf. fulva]